MPLKRISFSSENLTLEGVLSLPDSSGPNPAAVICHPHPLYGGSMDNNIVDGLFTALVKTGFAVLKFNYRGVGNSEGRHSGGPGEERDVKAALDFLAACREVDPKRIGAVGYSAGVVYGMPVAAADDRVAALAAISPPVTLTPFPFLKKCLKPKLMVCGDADIFAPEERFRRFAESLPEPKEFTVYAGVDHFWIGSEEIVSQRVAAFFSRLLKYPFRTA